MSDVSQQKASVGTAYLKAASLLLQGSQWWLQQLESGIITMSKSSCFIHGKAGTISLLTLLWVCLSDVKLGSHLLEDVLKQKMKQYFFPVSSTVIASNILLVDEIMRAGMSSLKGWAGAAPCGISPRNPPQGPVLGCGGCPSTTGHSATGAAPLVTRPLKISATSIKDLALKRSYLFLISLNCVAAVAFHFYPINCSVLCFGCLIFNHHPLQNIVQWRGCIPGSYSWEFCEITALGTGWDQAWSFFQ